MSTTNILDLNNRIDELSDGVTSVEDALDDMNKSYEVIATATSTSPADISTVDWTKYRFLTLTCGPGGAYGCSTIPACLFRTDAIKFFRAFMITHGTDVSTTAHLGTGKLTAEDAAYPATLYGIK